MKNDYSTLIHDVTKDFTGGGDTLSRDMYSTRVFSHVIDIGVDLPAVNEHSARRLYPHLFDNGTAPGEVLALIQSALENVVQAISALSVPDLVAVNSYLANVAALMAKAHPLTTFNEAFGSVVSYVRRASLLQNDVDRQSLSTLHNILEKLIENPALNLDDAVEYVDELKGCGWSGEIDKSLDIFSIIENLLVSDESPRSEQVRRLEV